LYSAVAEAGDESFGVALAVEDGLEPAEGLGGVVDTVAAFLGVGGEVVELELGVGRWSGEGVLGDAVGAVETIVTRLWANCGTESQSIDARQSPSVGKTRWPIWWPV